MKKKSPSQSAFFNLRVLIGLFVFLAGVFLALLGSGAFSNLFAQSKNTTAGQSSNPIYLDPFKAQAAKQAQPRSGPPDVVRMVGPVSHNKDLRSLPYMAPSPEIEKGVLTRYPRGKTPLPQQQDSSPPIIKRLLQPPPTMPAPVLTFDGMNSAQSGCNCLPSDSDGDVGPNHYVNAVNSSIKIFDKVGNPLNGPNGQTFNSFFSPLPDTNPCGNGQNRGDPFVFYDHLADRWVVSDFAFPSFPGTSFWQCIGVSQTPDPVAGGWHLYALQIDPANPNQLGDYPKFALWSNPQPGGAYHLTVNLFTNTTTFNGVRAFALDRASMLSGGFVNAIAFTVPIAGLGPSYSLVPAGFRTGNPPPAGRNEMLLAIDSPPTENVTLTQVKGWLFHVDFAVPANSTLGVGANHAPNALITVAPFVEAWTNAAGFRIVPQQGTAQRIDTLGDRMMTPVVYQNRNGTESLWADYTVILNFPNGPTGVRWYQFDVTGGNFPATPVQQQTWTNGGDGLWRFMPSIAVNQNGNTAIGYSISNPSIFPGIRYAGRLATDPLNDLGQGEAIMTNGGGFQSHSSGRWGDYSYLSIDPADNISFWHVNQYYPATASASWFTRIGKFQFPARPPRPTPGPSATPPGTPPPRP